MPNRRDDQRNYRGGSRRPRPVIEFKEIDKWLLVRNIADRARESGKSYVELRIDMERPQFKDKTKGYFRLNTLIVVDERSSLRLNTSALGILRKFFHDHDEDVDDAIAEVRRKNARIDERLLKEASQDRYRGLDTDPNDPNLRANVRDDDEDDDEEEGARPLELDEEPEPEEDGKSQPATESGSEVQSRRRTRRAP